MTYYKSTRIINGKPTLVITNEDGDIIDRNPTKEQINLAKKSGVIEYRISKSKRIKCCICGINKTNWNWRRYYDEKGCWDRKSYICKTCYTKDYHKKEDKNRYIRKYRIGQLSIKDNTGKGLITESIVED